MTAEQGAPIIVEQWYPVDRETLWQAITEPEQMRRWYFAPMEDFRPEVGFVTEFDVTSGDRLFRHHWSVTAVEVGERLTYEWRYPGYPGGPVTTVWRLSEAENGTRLTVTCSGMQSFPQEVPEFTRSSCEGGWQYFLQGQLKAYLGGD